MCVLQLAGEEYRRGSFAQSIAPPGAALGMMVGAGTRLRGAGSLLGTSTPSSVSLGYWSSGSLGCFSQCLETSFKVTMAPSALCSSGFLETLFSLWARDGEVLAGAHRSESSRGHKAIA